MIEAPRWNDRQVYTKAVKARGVGYLKGNAQRMTVEQNQGQFNHRQQQTTNREMHIKQTGNMEEPGRARSWSRYIGGSDVEVVGGEEGNNNNNNRGRAKRRGGLGMAMTPI